MRKFAPKHGLFMALALFAALSALFCTAPMARADELSYGCAYTDEGTEYYYSIDDCIKAAYEGKTIVFTRDWTIDETIKIEAGKSVSLDPHGSCIYVDTDKAYAFALGEGASLTIKSTSTAEYERTYSGFDEDTGEYVSGYTSNRKTLIATTDEDSHGGIRMDEGSTLTLENLAMVGCYSNGYGGAINVDWNCTLNLTNCDLEHNRGSEGGAIYVGGKYATINLDAAKVNKNHADNNGGGICSDEDGTKIVMKNGSTISNNYACECGGGIYFNESSFELVNGNDDGASDDLAPTICLNYSAESGGGIYTDSCAGDNQGTIDGITISKNTAAEDGGGLYLNQESTTVSNCTITGNVASDNGGGIYVNNDNIAVSGCTITGNLCDWYGKGGEGGGIFVSYRYDLALTGICTVTGNARGSSSDSTDSDDLFLSTVSGSSGYAYITGGVENGSSVGIRTGIEGERLLGKSISTYTTGTYFSDTDGYWISHGTDHDGDLWQRTGATDFELSVNGKSVGRFKPGAKLTINAKSLYDGEDFWKWSESGTTGLSPFSSYIPDVSSAKITFTMPQNDVDLAFIKKNVASNITVSAIRPVVGEELCERALVSWDYEGTTYYYSVIINWLDEGGTRVYTAEAGTKYRFYTVTEPDSWFCYDTNLDASNVTLTWDKGEAGPDVQDTHVDSLGYLNLTSGYYETEKPTVTEVDEASGSVMALSSVSDLLNVVPGSVGATLSDGTTTTLAVDKDAITWPEGLLDGDAVADVTAETTYENIELPLAASEKAADATSHTCKFTLTVLPSTEVAAPSLSLAGGTYNRYSGATLLSDDLTLNVTAACSAKSATVYYSLDDGAWTAYTSDGITLAGEADKSVSHKLQVWAVRNGVKSDVVEATYVLDDTLNKQVTIVCEDTALYGEGDTRWRVEKTVTANVGDTVSVTAPAEDGRTFDHWEWAKAPEGTDLTQETLQIQSFSPKYSGNIKAVYTPVITAVDLSVDVPVAHEALASATDVSVRVGSDDTTKDITSYLSGKGALTWSPDDATAKHVTCYTASLSLAASSSAADVKYKVADSLKLLIDGNEVEGGGWVDSDTQTLYVTFPSTGAYEYQSAENVADVDLSFADAYAYQEGQDRGATVSWGLPTHVNVTYKCGESEPIDVTWEVSGFDASATDAQTLTARGTINYPDYVDTTDAPEYVEVAINVAAIETVSAPVATPDAGTYTGTQTVTLSSDTEGATIHYTLDGTEPTADSPVYDGPIEVDHSCTLKAAAFHDVMLASETVEFSYTIKHVVSFDSAGGTEVASQEIACGERATKPADPVREGFTFDGWFTEDGEEYDFATPVDGDLTLYAKWSEKPAGDKEGDESGKGNDGDATKRGSALPATGDANACASLLSATALSLGGLGFLLRRKK
jgi:uncharacterized repeat protein (TIGR02543 family)